MPARRLLVVLATGCVALGLGSGRADAVPQQLQTFGLGGSLNLATAPTASLPATTSGVGGTTVSGPLGATTVTDDRFTVVAGTWTVTASCTDFSSGSSVVPKANVSIFSGPATATSGIVAFVPTTALTARSMAGSGGPIASATGVLLSTSVTYRPTMTVTVPASAPAGSYSATCTQTVA